MSSESKKKTKYLQSPHHLDCDYDKLYITIIEIVDDVPQGSYLIFVPSWNKCIHDPQFWVEIFLN